MFKRLLLALFALALLAAACGDSDSDSTTTDDGGSSDAELSSEEQEALGAVEDLGDNDAFAAMSRDEQVCVARALVSEDDLFEAMISDTEFESLELDQQLKAVELIVDCAPDGMAQAMADGITESSPNLSDDAAKCLADEVVKNRELLSAFMAAGATGQEPDADILGAVFELFSTCDIDLADLG